MPRKKYLAWLSPLAALFGCSPAAEPHGESSEAAFVVQQITPEDSEILEEWSLVVADSEIQGIGAVRISDGEWAWQVSVSAMEFVREEPLEYELSAAISVALSGVKGVQMAHHEDREVWAVNGTPEGAALVQAVAGALAPFSNRIEATLSRLESGG